MPTVLDRQPAVDREADELRKELEDLQGAIASLSASLARTDRERADVRAMLDDALDLRAALEHRLGELEDALLHQRLVSVIRGRLLADVLRTRLWRRGAALRRAERVEALLARTRAGT
jgi:predicted nuclease with TOPRIM domain